LTVGGSPAIVRSNTGCEEGILGSAYGPGVAASVHCNAVAEVRCAAGGEVLGGVLHTL